MPKERSVGVDSRRPRGGERGLVSTVAVQYGLCAMCVDYPDCSGIEKGGWAERVSFFWVAWMGREGA